MKCPHCLTENRDDRASCYHCSADLSLIRSATARAKNHLAAGLEHAGRNRSAEAIRELTAAVELDASLVNAWLALGTLRAQNEQFDLARAAWERALAADDRYLKAHQYLSRLETVRECLPAMITLRRAAVGSTLALIAVVGLLGVGVLTSPGVRGALGGIFTGPGSVVAALLLLGPLLFSAAALLYQSRGWIVELAETLLDSTDKNSE